MEIEENQNLESNAIEQDQGQKKRPFLLITIGIIVAIIVIVGIFYFTNKVSDKEESVIDVNINIEANPEVITDCGDIDCFKEQFSECKSSKVTYVLTNTITYYYEILGPKDDFCNVKSWFINNPNPEYIDKEMTCQYDNSLDFDTAVSDLSRCEGPLYYLLRGQYEE